MGALNDADEDDLDVYEADVSSSRSRLAYDARVHDDTLVLGDQVKSKKSEMVSNLHLPRLIFSSSLSA